MTVIRSPEALIAESQVAAVVSDPRRPDNPIIACNAAFMALTGYARGEIVGRNCRFLRGPLTEADRTDALRSAVAERRAAMVELTNYRKDGSSFRNAVMIAPLFDDAGEVRYFLGSQFAIDDGGEERRRTAVALVGALTARQRQVLEAMARGKLNKQIAFDIRVTERTVKMHRAALLRALGVRTTAEAIRIAVEVGL